MTTTINAACACKTFHLEVSFASSALPIDRALCLCSSCRQVSGSCGNSYIPLPPSALPVDPATYALTSYNTSGDLTRYFCSTCGSHVFVYRAANKTWHLATGLWDRTEGVINWTGCKWVQDTGDGGVSVWLKEVDDGNGNKRELKRWMLQDGDGETVPEGALESLPPRSQIPGQQTHAQEAAVEGETLKGQCHCGGVKYHITRPNSSSQKARSPFPDAMIPYTSGAAAAANPTNQPWFLRADNTKYLACACACTSCRVSLGFEIQTWAFVPRCNIFLLLPPPLLQDGGGGDGRRLLQGGPEAARGDAAPVVLDLARMGGTLKRYHSSAGVYREFCSACGATVFWHCDERPELIDVSVGLLDPEEGARAERWLEWTERVSFRELAVSESLVRSLQCGSTEWCGRMKEDGKERGG